MGGWRPSPAAAQGAGHHDGDDHDHEEQRDLGAPDGGPTRPGARRFRGRADPGKDRVDSRLQACGVAPFPEGGRDALADDLARDGVRNGSLQAVAHFEPDSPILHEDQDDDPVVEALLPHPPALGQPDGKILEILAIERRKDREGQLRARRPLPLGDPNVETLAVGGTENSGIVVDAGGGDGRDDEGEGDEDCEKQD
jgi:hypothetical protein